MLILPEKSNISDAISNMHSTYPNRHFTHIKRIAIFASFVSHNVVSQKFILFLSKFKIIVWICQLINPFVSNQISP